MKSDSAISGMFRICVIAIVKKEESMKKLKRILALLLVIFLIAMVFVTLYCAVTGSPYFMASLFTILGLPLLIYAYMFIYRLVKDREDK